MHNASSDKEKSTADGRDKFLFLRGEGHTKLFTFNHAKSKRSLMFP